MSKSTSQTRGDVGLVLSLKGAPDEPHTVQGLPGFYRPSRPTPVGGPGEATVEQAEEFSKKRSSPVELVDLKAGEVEKFRDAAAADHELARGNAETLADAQALVEKNKPTTEAAGSGEKE